LIHGRPHGDDEARLIAGLSICLNVRTQGKSARSTRSWWSGFSGVIAVIHQPLLRTQPLQRSDRHRNRIRSRALDPDEDQHPWRCGHAPAATLQRHDNTMVNDRLMTMVCICPTFAAR